ncbi:hypothetical protein GW17_00033791 [Ensete ventricosum]|uniref:Uncharacterized protein n=1 Tax=Ensete ventricosum TaxID=4639 RepID=A0A444DYA5_ENSVE|nr:hypothetical protein GW17_00033791 [Ensete ventricosum]RZR72465.1 hypothetical protein BHM03_00013714 [Ensete ventricosum]
MSTYLPPTRINPLCMLPLYVVEKVPRQISEINILPLCMLPLYVVEKLDVEGDSTNPTHDVDRYKRDAQEPRDHAGLYVTLANDANDIK